MTELPFCGGIVQGRYFTPCIVFTQPHRKNDHLVSFYGSKRKRLFRINLEQGNADNISHIPILTLPIMTSSLTSRGRLNYITQHFFLKFVCCAIIWYQNVPLQTSMVNSEGEANYVNLLFISINVSFSKTAQLKTFLQIFPHPNFNKNAITPDVSNGVNVKFVHRML